MDSGIPDDSWVNVGKYAGRDSAEAAAGLLSTLLLPNRIWTPAGSRGECYVSVPAEFVDDAAQTLAQGLVSSSEPTRPALQDAPPDDPDPPSAGGPAGAGPAARITAIGALVVAGALAVLTYLWSPRIACANDVIYQASSRDGQLKALVIRQQCGSEPATAGVTVAAPRSVIAQNAPYVLRFAVSAADSVSVRWQGDRTLVVSYPSSIEILARRELLPGEFGEVSVREELH